MKKILISLLTLATVLASSTIFAAPAIAAALTPALVIRVIDGDTIKVTINQTTETVRLIGIDTPERGQPRFEAATNFTSDRVLNQTVWLQSSGNDRDVHGRLRRYVWLRQVSDTQDNMQRRRYLLNQLLLDNGHAVIFGRPQPTAPTATAPPQTPGTPTVRLTALNRARVSWQRVFGAGFYHIYRQNGSGNWTHRGTVSGNAFNDRGLPRGRTVRYRVVAFSSGGRGSASTITTVTTLGTNRVRLTLTPRRRGFTVRRRNRVVGAQGYQIRFRRQGRGWITRNIGNNTTRRITGRAVGARYQVQIRALQRINNRNVGGQWSRAVNVTTRN